jgi:tight adherence protein B
VTAPEAAVLVGPGLAGGAVWLASGSGPASSRLRRLQRRDPASGLPRGGPAREATAAVTLRSPGLVSGLSVLLGCAAASLLSGYLTPLLLSPVVVLALRRWRCRAALRREAAARRAAVRRFCAAFAAELRSGRSPPDAAARAVAPLPGADTAALLGLRGLLGPAGSARAEPAEVLRSAGLAPGAEALRRVAACWLVAEQRGAGLAVAVERLVDGLQHEEARRQEVSAQLAGARATARLLGVLPVFGLLLGAGLGADPLHVLFGTPYGLACLLLGGVLDAAGLFWTERLARAAEGQP